MDEQTLNKNIWMEKNFELFKEFLRQRDLDDKQLVKSPQFDSEGEESPFYGFEIEVTDTDHKGSPETIILMRGIFEKLDEKYNSPETRLDFHHGDASDFHQGDAYGYISGPHTYTFRGPAVYSPKLTKLLEEEISKYDLRPPSEVFYEIIDPTRGKLKRENNCSGCNQ
jgi:hypothetical protein